jgi:hypothetical protein
MIGPAIDQVCSWVSGVRFQVSAKPLAPGATSLIDKRNFEKANIEC